MKKSLLISLLLISVSPLGFASLHNDYYITVDNETEQSQTLYDHWHSCVSKDDSDVESIFIAPYSEVHVRMVPHTGATCDFTPDEELHEALKGVGDTEEFMLDADADGTHKYTDTVLNPSNEKVKLAADPSAYHDSHVVWKIENLKS